MHRRTFLFSSASASLVAATGAIVPLAARADGHGAQVLAAQRFRIGEILVTALSDGYIRLPTGALQGIDAAGIAELFAQAHRDPAAHRAAVNAYLLQSNGETLLIDAGTGNLFGPTLGDVPVVLEALGIAPGDISRLIVTHLHGDHIGGMLRADGPLYPNAEVILTETDRAFWSNTDIRNAAPEEARGSFDLATSVLQAYDGQLRPVEGEADLAPGLTARPLPGHTPGHMGVMVESAGDSLMIWADLVHVPIVQMQRPEVTIGFDTDQPQAAATRADLFAELAGTGQKIAGMHMAFPGIGYLERQGEAFRFEPVGWQYL